MGTAVLQSLEDARRVHRRDPPAPRFKIDSPRWYLCHKANFPPPSLYRCCFGLFICNRTHFDLDPCCPEIRSAPGFGICVDCVSSCCWCCILPCVCCSMGSTELLCYPLTKI